MKIIQGKFEKSKFFVLNGMKYYKCHENANIAYCAFRRLKCTAKIEKFSTGEWKKFGVHKSSCLQKRRNFIKEKEAENEILRLCRANYNANHSTIFKDICKR